MRRHAPRIAALTLLLCGLIAPRAVALTRSVEILPPTQEVLLPGACGFDVLVTEREPRTLVTVKDGDRIVRQELSANQVTEFLNVQNRVRILLESTGTTVLVPNADGTTSITQSGTGAVKGQTTDGAPILLWVRGNVSAVGSYDQKSGTVTASSLSYTGRSLDLCEALRTGVLKSRH